MTQTKSNARRWPQYVVLLFLVAFIAAVFIGLPVMCYNLYASHDITKTKIQDMKQEQLQLQDTIDSLQQQLQEHDNKLQENENRISEVHEEISRGNARSFYATVTAYDLSVQSCGKPVGSYGYGITASGRSLVGETLWSARAIAVDPSVIPLGSKVRLVFEEENAKQYNGIYTAVDTGGAINGSRIDLFFGDTGDGSVSSAAMNFGVKHARVIPL